MKKVLSEEKYCRKKQRRVNARREEGAREKNDDKHEYLFKIRGRLMSVNERAADAVSFAFFALENVPDNSLKRGKNRCERFDASRGYTKECIDFDKR